MAADTRPPILGTALEGWRYVLAALSRMPVVLGAGMLIAFALNVARWWLLPDVANLLQEAEAAGGDVRQVWDVFQFSQIVSFLFMIARGFLLTPVVIAMHRFVLLGEVTQSYSLKPSQPRFMRFFVFSVVFQLLILIPTWLAWPISQASAALGLFSMLLLASAWIALLIASIIIAFRMLILFPAIAVDAGGAHWRNAISDTKGHTWRVFFMMLLTAIPVYVPQAMLYLLRDSVFASGIVLSAAQSVIGVLMLCALAAVASRLFAAFANKLKG